MDRSEEQSPGGLCPPDLLRVGGKPPRNGSNRSVTQKREDSRAEELGTERRQKPKAHAVGLGFA